VLARTIIVDGVPVYELATGDVLRPLDPTEHNMERLNAKARGSGRTYHILVIEGPLSRAALEQALDALASRHPLLRVRIVRRDDGTLCYAPTRGDRDDGTARVPVSYTVADDLSAWPELVEADMNAGAIASNSGPLFAFVVIQPPGLEDGASGRRVIVMVGHHGTCDGTSSIALLHELLEQLARPHAPARLEDRPLRDPFCLDLPVPELAEIETQARSALDAKGARRREELEALRARLEQLESRLLAERDGEGHFPVALKSVQGRLSSLYAELLPARGLVPEIEVTGAGRYERARTALLVRTLGVEPTRALRRAAKEQALTLHGAFAAAVLMALETERAAGAEATMPPPERLALASAVSLRKQLVPPLSSHDLRMAVDIHVSRIPVEAGVRFWELARRAGDDVTRAVGHGRALSSYFRTVQRDFGETPPGIAIPLLSNLGRAELGTHYGQLKVLELGAAMATHGSFQLCVLSYTFDERLSLSCYCETPTVSRAALERLAARVVDTLTRVAGGEEPRVSG
jgi:hypothetical protein